MSILSPKPTRLPQFDDGVYDCVKKVIIGEDSQGVAYITIQYVRNGDVVQLEHGSERGAHITETEFEVKDPDEYITCIEGTGGEANRYDSDIQMWPPLNYMVTELQFKTSHGRTSQNFGKPGADSIKFKLKGKNGTKLVGLYGRSGRFLNALGAHFVVVPSTFKQIEPEGGSDGYSWNDGAYDGLRKVCIGEYGGRVSSVEFVYAKGNECVTHCHGNYSNERKEFELQYEDGEYIISFEGTTDNDGYISSLIFNTSMDRSSHLFGKVVTNNKFFVKARGFDKLVGFRGRSCLNHINALGANFTVAPSVKKLQAQGISLGKEWDDGVHDNVRMITVTYDQDCVISVTFEYANGTETVLGDPHGDLKERDDKKEFKLCDKNEYITSVEGFFGQDQSIDSATFDEKFKSLFHNMKRLDFITNVTTYSVLENDTRDRYVDVVPFKLEEKDHKIVGFHGKSTQHTLQQIGVYLKPINDAN